MVAINSALQIDLTGQSSSEAIGKYFYSGIGGHADFMRGTALSPNGKTILTLRSTSNDGQHSRIVPLLEEGSGRTLTRGDVHYVITEYGIAYLHGKNIRERAMDLIAIAHPKFRPWLIEEAKNDWALFTRTRRLYPASAANIPRAWKPGAPRLPGCTVLLRPVKISDEPMVKDFFYSLSDRSLYRRFISKRQDMPHERLQEFVVIDYTQEMIILAVVGEGESKEDRGHGPVRHRYQTPIRRKWPSWCGTSIRPRASARNCWPMSPIWPSDRGCSASPPRCWWRTSP